MWFFLNYFKLFLVLCSLFFNILSIWVDGELEAHVIIIEGVSIGVSVLAWFFRCGLFIFILNVSFAFLLLPFETRLPLLFHFLIQHKISAWLWLYFFAFVSLSKFVMIQRNVGRLSPNASFVLIIVKGIYCGESFSGLASAG